MRTSEENKAYMKAYYLRNREAMRAQQAVYNGANREKLREWHKTFYAANKERRRAGMKAFHAANPGYRKKYMDQYYAENRSKFVAKARSRRDHILENATPSWADEMAIEQMYALAARKSRETGIPHEVDHIVPLIHPKVCGLHVEHNLQVLTRAENRAKRNHHEGRYE